jgi:hypothetical protein
MDRHLPSRDVHQIKCAQCITLAGWFTLICGFHAIGNSISNGFRILSYNFLETPIHLPLGDIFDPFENNTFA